MKKNLLKILTTLCLLALSVTAVTGCTTTKVKEPDPYFLGDFDAFNLGKISGLTKQNFFAPKAATVGIDFYPRFSGYSADFRDGMNKVLLVFSAEEAMSLAEGINTYLALDKSDSFDKNHKPGRKNNFQSGKVHIYWGATGYGRDVMAPYSTNYEYINGNPYFKLNVKPASYPEEEHVSSPTIDLYITPNQLEALKEITNKDVIMEEINKLNDAVYSFD